MSDLLFHAFFTSSKVGKTGLTVTLDIDKVERATGTRTIVATAASASEMRNGHYAYRLANVTDLSLFDYVAVFKTSDTTVDAQYIPSYWGPFPIAYDTQLAFLNASVSSRATPTQAADAVWDEAQADHVAAGSMGASMNAAGAAADPLTGLVPGSYPSGSAGYALGRIGNGRVVTTSVISTAGSVETVRGDDYYAADGRRITWVDVDANWPDLTGATITINIGGAVQFTGVVVNPSGANKSVGLELSAVQTATIPINTSPGHDYAVVATLVNTHKVTLVTTNKPDSANDESRAKWMSIGKVEVGI